MRATVLRTAWWMMLAAFATPAFAQTFDNPGDVPLPPLTADESAALGSALMFDPTALTLAAPAKPLRLPSGLAPQSLDVSHSDKPDGSTTVVVKKPLAAEWDTKVGADLGLAAQHPTDGYRPGRPIPGSRAAAGSGTAWASVGVPNFGSVDARVDPTNDQGKVGTTLKQSIPIGRSLSLTLQDSYSVTETLGTPAPGPADLPLMTLPAPGTPSPQVWGNEKLAKFDVLSTGTTLAAGVKTATGDPVTHNKFSAEQKVYGPLHVTTAVTDLGQPVPNKSISAGFKLHW